MNKPITITFRGPRGSGKTTALGITKTALTKQGHDALQVEENKLEVFMKVNAFSKKTK